MAKVKKKTIKDKTKSKVEKSGQWAIDYRPKTLDEVILPEAVKGILKQALRRKGKSVPTAFLISGQTGVGKTTLASILADTFSDGNKRDCIYHDCGQDPSVGSIRNLVQESTYAPTAERGRRVIVLDEVQALQAQAVKALLGVLEQKNTSTVWVLCTDQPGKILKTIKDRCLNIPLTALNKKETGQHLLAIAKKEGVYPKSWSKGDLTKLTDSITAAAAGSARAVLAIGQAAFSAIDECRYKTFSEAKQGGAISELSESFDTDTIVGRILMAAMASAYDGKNRTLLLDSLRRVDAINVMTILILAITQTLMDAPNWKNNRLVLSACEIAETKLTQSATKIMSIALVDLVKAVFAAKDAVLLVPASGPMEAHSRLVALVASAIVGNNYSAAPSKD